MTLADTLPTPKEERWKYTNLPSAIRKLANENAAPAALRVTAPEGVAGLQGQSLSVDIPAGKVMEAPVEIHVDAPAQGVAAPQLAVRLGANAQAVIVEHHGGGGAAWNNMKTRIELAAGARLVHYRVQDYGAQTVYTQDTAVSIARDATYDSFTLTTGANLSRHEIHARLDGPGAHAELNGVNLLRGTQHGDTTITIDHRAPSCTSHQFYRSVLDNQARGVFQGKIYVAKAAQKTDGYQLSRAILLSEGAEMDTKPELEIYADDVKCSHGATTGQLDEEALFYMRSRGIGREEARGLLISAFVNEAVEKIGDEAVRKEFAAHVAVWLGKHAA
jgi:Fe-S cluster assembly protein SufD